jgi:hypothetical protein
MEATVMDPSIHLWVGLQTIINLLFAVTLLTWRRRTGKVGSFLRKEKHARELADSMSGLIEESNSAGERLISSLGEGQSELKHVLREAALLERNLFEATRKAEEVLNRLGNRLFSSAEDDAYGRAVGLVRKGISAEAAAREAGLGKGEVESIIKMIR